MARGSANTLFGPRPPVAAPDRRGIEWGEGHLLGDSKWTGCRTSGVGSRPPGRPARAVCRTVGAGGRCPRVFSSTRVCRTPDVPWTGDRIEPAPHGATPSVPAPGDRPAPLHPPLRGRQRLPARGRPAGRDRRARAPAARPASPTSSCSARPAPARARRPPGWSSGCSARRWSWRRTRRSPPSWPTSSASCCRTTRSSTSSATTTTTSPRRTSRRPTPTSRRTPRSTRRSSGCGTARR